MVRTTCRPLAPLAVWWPPRPTPSCGGVAGAAGEGTRWRASGAADSRCSPEGGHAPSQPASERFCKRLGELSSDCPCLPLFSLDHGLDLDLPPHGPTESPRWRATTRDTPPRWAPWDDARPAHSRHAPPRGRGARADGPTFGPAWRPPTVHVPPSVGQCKATTNAVLLAQLSRDLQCRNRAVVICQCTNATQLCCTGIQCHVAVFSSPTF